MLSTDAETLDLDRVQDLLTTHGWGKGSHPIGDELCLTQAVARVLGVKSRGPNRPAWSTVRVLRVSEALFGQIIRTRWPNRVADVAREDTVWTFNDHDDTRVGDIRDLIAEAKVRREYALLVA